MQEWFEGRRPTAASVIVASTAGSDTMTVTLRLWGYSSAAASWSPVGVGTAAGKGVLNAGAAIAETSADKIAHAEPLTLPTHFDRAYCQVTAIGGTATAVSVWLTAGEEN